MCEYVYGIVLRSAPNSIELVEDLREFNLLLSDSLKANVDVVRFKKDKILTKEEIQKIIDKG